MKTKTAGNVRIFFTVFLGVILLVSGLFISGGTASAQDNPPPGELVQELEKLVTSTEIVNEYFTVKHLTMPDGTALTGNIIAGPSKPPAGLADQQATIVDPLLTTQAALSEVPAFTWVFGCSAVSGSMVAGYYDRTGYANMYTGPTNGGVVPLVEAVTWGSWGDGDDIYPNNPLIASHNGLDGWTVRGSIDDYWVMYGSSASDPFITGGWTQHTWGSAIGDYMKTSQSDYGNTDGATTFYSYPTSSTKLTCSAMESLGISDVDGTYGRKLFYEARGYSVTDCYAQATDNKATGGFSLANFRAEIDAGRPVFLNLAGHSIVGVGYDPSSTTIYIHDTWDNSTHSMTWGGSYSGLELRAVSIVNLSGGVPPTPPAAPTGVSASDGTYTDKVRVSWTASTGASSYQVYRNTSNVSGGAALIGSPSAAPYDDTTAVAGTTYWYFLKACNAGGCSGFSASDSGYRAAVVLPGAFNKTAPANGVTNLSTRVTLTWGTSAGATAYWYCYDTTNDNACSKWVSNRTATSKTLSLKRATTYYWHVRAVNANGTTYSNGSGTAFWSFRTK